MENCKEGAAVKIGRGKVETSGDGNVERPNITSRVSAHMFVDLCDSKEVNASNHHEFFGPCDILVASYDNTGADTAVFELVAPCDNLGSTYSGRVLFLPF